MFPNVTALFCFHYIITPTVNMAKVLQCDINRYLVLRKLYSRLTLSLKSTPFDDFALRNFYVSHIPLSFTDKLFCSLCHFFAYAFQGDEKVRSPMFLKLT
jgi:hypothetical protein